MRHSKYLIISDVSNEYHIPYGYTDKNIFSRYLRQIIFLIKLSTASNVKMLLRITDHHENRQSVKSYLSQIERLSRALSVTDNVRPYGAIHNSAHAKNDKF